MLDIFVALHTGVVGSGAIVSDEAGLLRRRFG